MAAAAGTTGTVPTTAERIRSVCFRGQALLAMEAAEPVAAPVCHLLPDGGVAVAVREAAAAEITDAGVQAVLEFTDHAPLPLRERVRALVWIRGHLTRVPPHEVADVLDRIAAEDANPALLQVRSPRSRTTQDSNGDDGRDDVRYTLLRLTVESVVAADSTGAEAVGVTELLAARPDPLRAIEATWLKHLSSSHPEVIARLAAKLPPRLHRGPVRPLGVDRYGIWLRVEAPDGDHDARLSFGAPVDDVGGLNRAVRLLMGCPFVNGLRPRST